jgi:NOL1/NOP2/fmu family ribosome biogenesis protein
MDGSRTVTATFEIDTFTIAASASGNGSISPTGDATVAYGSDLTFIITPNAHNHIADVLVDGTSVGAVGSYTFANVTVGHTIQAAFAVDQETLTVSTAGSGTVARTPDASSYAYGAAVSLTATPALGWHFVGWSGDLTGSANPAGLTMDGSKMLSAMFVADLTVQILDRSLSIYRGTYATLRALTSPGASCTIAVVLPSGATSAAAGLTPKVADAGGIVSWTWLVAGNTLPGMGSVTVTASAGGQVRQDVVSWSVLPHEYSLGVTVAGSGSVARSPDQAMYDFGTVVTLTANPAAGWHFVSWSGDATGSTSPVSVTVNENKNVTAAFEQDPSSLTVQILDRALAVYRGNNATMSAQTLPGASCSIVVMLPSGRASTAAGLGPKVAGADGKVSWTWLVGGTTATGAGSITVTATLGINTAQDTVSWTVLTH